MNTPISLLYVDDEPDIRTIATLALQLDPNIEVQTAASAREALGLLTVDWTPTAIILDVMMPDVDGPALAAQIRSIPRYAEVPIIFMTARARGFDIASYHGMGAKGVIVKPFDPIGLATEVRTILTRR